MLYCTCARHDNGSTKRNPKCLRISDIGRICTGCHFGLKLWCIATFSLWFLKQLGVSSSQLEPWLMSTLLGQRSLPWSPGTPWMARTGVTGPSFSGSPTGTSNVRYHLFRSYLCARRCFLLTRQWNLPTTWSVQDHLPGHREASALPSQPVFVHPPGLHRLRLGAPQRCVSELFQGPL